MHRQQVLARVASVMGERPWLAPLALAVSALARLVLSFVTPTGLNMVDLRVYTFGAASLSRGA
ncbi:MAG: hypothetical protein ACXVGI_10445, partial [Mycobacteriaceae bacterium]